MTGTRTGDYCGLAVGGGLDVGGWRGRLRPGVSNGGALYLAFWLLPYSAYATDLEVLYSPTAGNLFGTSVASGDFDGDGVSDVFGGATEDDSGGGNAGAIFGWYGLGL